MNKIVIIGTVPPCPRCGVLTDIVRKKVGQLGIDVGICHIAYTSEDARIIAKKEGLVPGTAKDVAKKVGEEIDLSSLPSYKDEQLDLSKLDPSLIELEKELAKASILDKRLRPYEYMAKDLGVLMTPVLIINDEIKHQGSVPKISDIENWLKALK